MSENLKIKEELFSLYQNIKSIVPNEKMPTNRENNTEDINSYNSLILINNIKDLIPLITNNKNFDNNNHEFNSEFTDYNKILEDYNQLENQIRKLEVDNKYYLKILMQYKIQNNSLEMKLNAYMSLEDEYEELKEKVKYEGGKFLENDRKDNEIIILRNENSNLKKEILKLEIKNKTSEKKMKEYQKTIKELQSNVENLNKKIFNLDKIIKDIKNNYNHNNNNSCTNENIGKKKISNSNMHYYQSNNSLNSLKDIINHNHKFNNQRVLNFHSPKNDILFLEHNKMRNNHHQTINTINTNIFTSTYNRIINGNNNKKVIVPAKNDFNRKKTKSNSIASLKRKEEKYYDDISLNKYNRDNNEKFLHKSINQTKSFNKTLNAKFHCMNPLSCKNSKNNEIIVRKYIQKEFNRNSSAQNIRMNLKKL
jgi:hypothetical protein